MTNGNPNGTLAEVPVILIVGVIASLPSASSYRNDAPPISHQEVSVRLARRLQGALGGGGDGDGVGGLVVGTADADGLIGRLAAIARPRRSNLRLIV